MYKEAKFSKLGKDFGDVVAVPDFNNSNVLHINDILCGDLKLDTTQDFQLLLKAKGFASVYSGHQFGSWAGQLGDGRALLLGEISGYELNLKGSGKTPYSRFGDGLAILKSSIREYLASEYLHQINIPSSRCLAIFTADDLAQRQQLEPTAIVARTAKSFIRFGHIEHFYHNKQLPQLKTLLDFCIDNIYPKLKLSNSGNIYSKLLASIVINTAKLVAHWQAKGFCHGVLNTDNMAVSAETIDYGPYAFIEIFNPNFICNSSDYHGRYSYKSQPEIVFWNCQALAQCFSGFCNTTAITDCLNLYKQQFIDEYYKIMAYKMGINSDNQQLIDDFIMQLYSNKIDYHHSFLALKSYKDAKAINLSSNWLQKYFNVADTQKILENNPNFVLRNTQIDIAIKSLVANKDSKQFMEIFKAITKAYSTELNKELLRSNISTLIESCSS